MGITRNFERGQAELEVTKVFQESTLTSAYATSPMKLLTPRSRGLSVWSYTSSFGGGLVAGDQTHFEVRIRRAARCFVGTQSATKIYRNPGRQPCGHVTRAVLEEDSFLAFMPSPVQPFADSCYAQKQTFYLAPGAGLVLLDSFTAGRMACGERWAFAQFSSRNEVFAGLAVSPPASDGTGGVGGNGDGSATPGSLPAEHPPARRVFLDSVCLEGRDNSLNSPHGTGRMNCFAMLLLLGASLRERAGELLAIAGRKPVTPRASLLVSASPVAEGAVLRLAGERADQVEAELHRYLGFLSGWLGDLPWLRQW